MLKSKQGRGFRGAGSECGGVLAAMGTDLKVHTRLRWRRREIIVAKQIEENRCKSCGFGKAWALERKP